MTNVIGAGFRSNQSDSDTTPRLRVGNRFYFTREGEHFYKEVTRLSCHRGDIMVQGYFGISSIGPKRYHISPIWLDTHLSKRKRHYKFQQDLIAALENDEDLITRSTAYATKNMRKEILDSLFDTGIIRLIKPTNKWIPLLSKTLLLHDPDAYRKEVDDFFAGIA
jgi:hypothetical protein